MPKVINELTLKLNADAAELKKDLAKAKAQLTGFNKGISDLGATIKGAFAVGAIVAGARAISNFGQDVSKLGGELAGTVMNFKKLNEPGLLDKLREATGGTISDFELMKQALDADDMKVSFANMAKIMAYARNEVQETGGSVTNLSSLIVNSLGKGSTKALTQAGISIKDYKAEFAKTGDMVTAVMNLIDKKLKDSGTYIETASDITARWAARWENIKGAIGLFINEGIKKIGPYLEAAWEWSKKLFDYVMKATLSATNTVIDFINSWIDLYNESMLFRGVINLIAGSVKNMWEVFKVVGEGIWTIFSNLGETIGYTLNPKNWGAGFTDGLAKIQKEGSDELIKIGKTFGKNVAENYYDAIKSTLNGKAKLIHLVGGATSETGAITETKKDATELGKTAARAYSEGVKSIEIKPIAALGEMDLGKSINISAIQQKIVPFKEAMKSVSKSVVDMSGLIRDAMQASFEAIGNGIGELLSGNGLKGMFQDFIGIVTSFMSQFGKLLIAMGVAQVAFRDIFVNPVAAIAAGIALIALSKVASNMMAKQKFASGGIVGGYSYSGDHVPILANSGEMILNAGQQASLFSQINSGRSGGGGSLTARVSGNDLLFILEQSQKKRGYTY